MDLKHYQIFYECNVCCKTLFPEELRASTTKNSTILFCPECGDSNFRITVEKILNETMEATK